MKTNTKSKLISSLLVLCLCVTMFVGSTYAWFTDSVTSVGNKIQSGTLKVDLEVLNDAGTEWKSIKESKDPLFTYDKWEPGYTDVTILKIENEGTLALKWFAKFVSSEDLGILADVIDVYVLPGVTGYPADRNLEGYTRVGTVAEFVNTIESTTVGVLDAGKSATLGIALKMQESADNTYQNQSLGSFDIKIEATQQTSESDSFDNMYDEKAPYPVAKVTYLGEKTVNLYQNTLDSVTLDTAFQFEPTESYEAAQKSDYRYWHADFVVSADKDVPANSMMVAGFYHLFCDLVADGKWVGLTSDAAITAGQEVRLVHAMSNGGISVNYEELCNYGNDGTGFQCGAADLTGANVGTTLSVELRLYETEEPSAANGNSHNVETGDYIVIGTYHHTFAEKPVAVTTAAELTAALADGKNVKFSNDITTEAATAAPYGNKYAFKQDGGIIDGGNHELHMECYGDDYGIMTSGGTIKNLTIEEGCRAIMIMYPTEDIIIDNVMIGGNGVLYPINTGETGPNGADGIDVIVSNSTLKGWTSLGNAVDSVSFTNCKFEQGTYYDNIYGRVLKPYVNTTLTDCSFIEHFNLDLSSLVAGDKVTIKNCTVNGQLLTAALCTIPANDDQYDTELFTVDLPSWATSLADCIVFE